jgi:hypothetical protein
MFLNFSPQGFFHGNNYNILCCNFLLFFSTGFKEFLHKHLLYTSLDFSRWIFQRLYPFYVMFKCSRESVTTQVLSDHLSLTIVGNHRASNCRVGALPGAPPTEPSRSYAVAPLRVAITHVYKKEMNE